MHSYIIKYPKSLIIIKDILSTDNLNPNESQITLKKISLKFLANISCNSDFHSLLTN